MTGRTLAVMVMAMVSGVSAAVGVNRITQNQGGPAPEETVSVVVAKADIPRGTTLSPDRIEIKQFPRSVVPPNAIESVEAANERVTLVSLVQDEPVLDSKLTAADMGRGLAGMVSPGMRAFTINTPSITSTVAGFILPGNRVDVLLTIVDGREAEATGGGLTTTLVQNLEILAVDTLVDAPAENKNDPSTLQSVTLAVTPEQAARLSLAQKRGELQLSLRSHSDELAAETRPVTMDDLRFLEEPPVVPQAPSEPVQVTVAKPAPQPPQPLMIRTLRGRVWSETLLHPYASTPAVPANHNE